MQKYIRSLASSSRDLHPHQIDAAVFAHRACFSEGVMIADEHTLGKRVTAGIILLQERIESQKPLIVLCKQ